MHIVNELAHVLYQTLDGKLTEEKIQQMIEKPKYEHLGDYSFPCFELAKILRKSPNVIAPEIANEMQSPIISHTEIVGGYVNIFLQQEVIATSVLTSILQEKESYGTGSSGNDKVVTIDLSSPNIAKPFSMGHLRSTVIGNSLALLAEKQGFQAVRINHLGDWGTQFGKLIVAYKKWGKEEIVRENPIQELLKLYVQFHEEAETAPSLEDEARAWFKKLENGDKEALELWEWFRHESWQEFLKIYDILGIKFDSNDGEAFYNDKMDRVVKLLEEKSLLKESDGAQVVELEDLPPCLIKKSDGTTLYATRDLAAALYRQETYEFDQSLYVVGNEQSLHFKQVYKVLEKMGYDWHSGLKHIPFGMMLKDGKKMSTRKGKVVLLESVLKEAMELALTNIEEKNPGLVNKEAVAKQVGTGAVIFHDLKNYRLHDIEFSLEDMLKFEGETGPYLQYTHARASSLLRKGNFEPEGDASHHLPEAWQVIIQLYAFPEVVARAWSEYDPSQVAKYLMELARAFNKFYGSVRILDDTKWMQARITVVFAVTVVLKEGLRLLGMTAPLEM
ncbi:arginine--tRNA ligase [Mangrovibacillus cuniculi]|uniref:Arginine--tRNA ligase n=1 Tax=Mangrovibacillus cuniculi TaxID=2593652 RepID=A0A7S8C9J8_9BACI|nr:arginine--tRNA ligase [Mangrovibacillus cuniculi]QPC45884.1 arginine--tRNA ligase [Mangrovibacillus cuniculi]